MMLTPTVPVSRPVADVISLLVADKPYDFTTAPVRKTFPFNQAGHPALAMPISFVSKDLSQSLQVIAGRDSHNGTLKFGRTIESDFGGPAKEIGSSQLFGF